MNCKYFSQRLLDTLFSIAINNLSKEALSSLEMVALWPTALVCSYGVLVKSQVLTYLVNELITHATFKWHNLIND